jgi:predicted amidohydrolase
MFGQSVIVAPSGEIAAKTSSEEDEVIVHRADLSLGEDLRRTMFNLSAHRRPEHYGMLVDRVGVEVTPTEYKG